MFPYSSLILCRNRGYKFFPDDLVAGFIEVPAIGLVDKYMGSVRQEPGDEFRLIFDDIPVPLFAQLRVVYSEYSR